MTVETTRSGLRRTLASARAQDRRIALVPTMGYLHEGHLSLADHARQVGDVVVMSIYVNPLQFGPGEDLARYPRDFERDARLARARGVDLIFAPADREMYETDRPAVTVSAGEWGTRFEGEFRPGHFDGVLTVVAKLFNLVQPDTAVFGQKDFQQSVLIRRMCSDLNFPVGIVVAPTVREPDGLALSSRNVYLNSQERASALHLSRALSAASTAFRGGLRDVARLLAAANSTLALDDAVHVQYVEIIDPASLERPPRAEPGHVIAVAAKIGSTRLIDNMILGQ